jgi:hypothetical protein
LEDIKKMLNIAVTKPSCFDPGRSNHYDTDNYRSLKNSQDCQDQKATMALTVYMAKRQGVDENLIRELIKDTGEEIMFHKDETA